VLILTFEISIYLNFSLSYLLKLNRFLDKVQYPDYLVIKISDFFF
jgi:hypothetical protein